MGVRVQKVQKVQRVQRGRLTGLRPEGYVEGLCSLRSGGNSACGAEGCGLPLCGNAYKVSVTD